MTGDLLTAAPDQIATHREQLSQLEDREARHFASLSEQLTQLAGMLTALGRAWPTTPPRWPGSPPSARRTHDPACYLVWGANLFRGNHIEGRTHCRIWLVYQGADATRRRARTRPRQA